MKTMKLHRPLLAIRKKCLDCCCNQYNEVRDCDIKTCTLWPYRFGKRPTEDVSSELKEK